MCPGPSRDEGPGGRTESHMKTIGIQCPVCRRTEDLPASCLLVEVGDGTEERARDSSATWICESCDELVALSVDLTVLLALVAAGASVLDNALEDERPEYPENAVAGDPFTFDDLL